ncbi:Qat anti-phage system QueC-like protein QatC [Pontibacter litorisediminis]|uniref:Qat anti-phage system QueC-like protein QatC n=1 Tax=Pontibacter litorisediminis TaxID=1846260 RepID=UPI0023EB006C|nr:Qat anti-phage system QueC-like protein QatC [Pontibacter litorisediminis]
MPQIGIELRIGNHDEGALVEHDQFSAFYTFHIQNTEQKDQRISIKNLLKELRRLKLNPSLEGLDLLSLACAAYAADTSINRYRNSDDGWTRQFHLFVPVSDVSVWQPQQELITEILNFLTGDLWQITFRQSEASIVVSTRTMKPTAYVTDDICLFSGGMDSFIGAMKLLDEGKRPLLVGHAKSSDVSEYRNNASRELMDRYSTLSPDLVRAFVRVGKPKLHGRAMEGENTERGRSFLFLALGAACATALPASENNARKNLYIPENGFITLNLPLTPLRIGAYSTRTTHPYYLTLMQRLFNAVGIAVDVINPFEFKTKGEMLLESGAASFVAEVDTMSCSRPSTRNANIEGAGRKHCGRCVPCIIRRAALKKANQPDDNDQLIEGRRYRTDIYKTRLHASTAKVENKTAKGENVMAFKYMIERVRQDPNFLTAAIRLTGPLEFPDQSLAVYKRGLEEVEAVLQNVTVVE